MQTGNNSWWRSRAALRARGGDVVGKNPHRRTHTSIFLTSHYLVLLVLHLPLFHRCLCSSSFSFPVFQHTPSLLYISHFAYLYISSLFPFLPLSLKPHRRSVSSGRRGSEQGWGCCSLVCYDRLSHWFVKAVHWWRRPSAAEDGEGERKRKRETEGRWGETGEDIKIEHERQR